MTRLGPFRIEERVAAGGMGVVYRAVYRSGRDVAVKLLDPAKADEHFLKQFAREVEATARLHHQNVVGIYDYGYLGADAEVDGFGEGTPYYVMEYVAGGALDTCHPANWEELEEVLAQILSGLAHAHARDVIHRDIKPANILVKNGGSIRYLLTDFGIAHATDTQTSTFGEDETGSSLEQASGTPIYMAPEQFLGTWRGYGPWTDLYAVGMVAWHLSCGKPPYRKKSFVELGLQHIGEPLPEYLPQFDVPDRVELWIRRMTAKAPQDRYGSAAEALSALRGAVRFEVGSWRDARGMHRVSGVGGVGLELVSLRRIPLVGREDERDALWRVVEAAREGRARFALIEGPPGAGKSRLGEWLYQDAAELGAADAVRVESSGQLGGLAGLFHALFRSAGLASEELYTRIVQVSGELEVICEPRLIADFLSGEGGTSADQVFEAAARLLEELGRKRPLLVVVDDVDRNDELIRFLEFAARRLTATSVAIVATVHEPASPALMSLRGDDEVTRVELTYLSDAEIESVIGSKVRLPWEVTETILERCSGSPMFAVQLLQHWVEASILVTDGAEFVLRDDTETAVPATLGEVWEERLERFIAEMGEVRLLDENRFRVATAADVCRKQLAAAAVLGPRVDTGEWSAVCVELEIRRPPVILDELVRHGLARRVEGGVMLVHSALSDAILKRCVSEVSEAALHAVAASVIARLHGDRRRGLSLRMARHLLAAGAYRAAMAAAAQAAETARNSYDVVTIGRATAIWDECADRAGFASDDPARADSWTLRAYALLLGAGAQNRDEARALLDRSHEVVARAEDPALAVRVAARRAVGSMYLGGTAEAVAELGAKLSVEVDAGSAAEGYLSLARARAALGDAEGQLAGADAALKVDSSDAVRMQAEQIRGRALLELRRLAEAREAIERSGKIAEARNWVIAEARGYETLAFIADSAGEFSEAARWHRRALHLFELAAPRTSYPDKQREYLARALLAAGEVEDAAHHIASVRAGLEAGKVGFYTHIEDVELAVSAARGDWDRFDTVVEAAFRFERFPPFELHRRALSLAAVHAARHGKSARDADVRRRLFALCGEREGLAALDEAASLGRSEN